MDKVFTPLEAEFVEEDGEYLEVVVLLIAHHIDHLVDGEVLETEFGSTDVLGHIDGGAVGTEEEFLVQSFTGEVSPYGAIVTTVEEPLFKSLDDFLLTFEISI